MEHYKSWAGLKKQLSENLCDSLKPRISYFLTRYHDVHNSYGRASIQLDEREMVRFSWIEMYYQDRDLNASFEEGRNSDYEELARELKPKWDAAGTYCEMDFLNAVLLFRNMSIQEALRSENYIIKIFAILDRRVGKRTLAKLADEAEYRQYPEWVRQFYELRLSE